MVMEEKKRKKKETETARTRFSASGPRRVAGSHRPGYGHPAKKPGRLLIATDDVTDRRNTQCALRLAPAQLLQ